MEENKVVQFPAEWTEEIDKKIESFQKKKGFKTKREALRQILRMFFENEVKNGNKK